jgi:hypothetical protein
MASRVLPLTPKKASSRKIRNQEVTRARLPRTGELIQLRLKALCPGRVTPHSRRVADWCMLRMNDGRLRRSGRQPINGAPTMKPDDYLETSCGVSPQRVLVDFEIACSAAIPMRDAAGSNAAPHASLFMPNLLVRQIVIPTRLSSPTRGTLRAELFSVEQLARHARTLAAHHPIVSRRGSNVLLARLDDNERILRTFHRELRAATRPNASHPPPNGCSTTST